MELTILIPCLNEEKTIGRCIKKAHEFINKNNIQAEILVVDNGSTDNSVDVSKKLNARVIHVPQIGYGNALIEGTKAALGKYTIMGDADDSYNFLELEEFISKLREGNELVIGNRYKGKMEKGAMKLSHKYIGTPIISKLAQKLFDINIEDFNCGLRGYETQKIIELNCNSSGMEYATEMIIKAKKRNLKMVEIPINFYKDKREKASHLRTIRDGIRHFKIIFNNLNIGAK